MFESELRPQDGQILEITHLFHILPVLLSGIPLLLTSVGGGHITGKVGLLILTVTFEFIQ